MQEKARKLFIEMVRDCGKDIVRMQASFEMYLGQYLTDYPDEKQLLLDAFKVGIPEKILQHAGEKDYSKYLHKLGPRFAEASRRLEDESAWAVETWAMALNRTADYVPEEKIDRFYAEDHIDSSVLKQEQTIAYTAMTLIVSGGGFLGGAAAACLLPIALFASGFSDAVYTAGHVTGQYRVYSEMDQVLFFALIGLAGGSVSGVAAFGGWWLGKGAENPWDTFGVACGTAFTVFLIAAFVPLAMLLKPILLFGSVFGATYTSAARGGQY
ncbi:hypothetical protein BH11PLA2_BH11PLA2_25820 [soil metagenome]